MAISEVEILTPDEVGRVISLEVNGARAWTNRMIFRLSACCGLRRIEIAGLDMDDVRCGPDEVKPHILVKTTATKRVGKLSVGKKRLAPLWWDTETLREIQAHKMLREASGAKPKDPFICMDRQPWTGGRFQPKRVSQRWFTSVAILGKRRIRLLSVHSGRHTFCSHSLAAGRSLVEVQRAVGHADAKMTSQYLHLIDREGVPDVFGGILRSER